MSIKLFPDLEAFILRSAPPHRAVDQAPETLDELNRWAAKAVAPFRHTAGYWVGPDVLLPVWNGASGSTIYSSPEVNFAYRAWHDWTHLQLQADVDYPGEYRVSLAHLRAARDAGVSRQGQLALWYDSHGQNAYHARYGTFVEDQRSFVLGCLAVGLDKALEVRW